MEQKMIARIIYEIRWWRWFLSGPGIDMKLYQGPYKVDRDSRRLIYDRRDEEHNSKEPSFNGTYPHRKQVANGN